MENEKVKLTDEEIEKALEICGFSDFDCKNCPYFIHLKQVRKETEKEILIDLRKDISQCYGEYALEIVDEYIEKYGIEVDE